MTTKELIDMIEDECFTYAEDMKLKSETYSFGEGVQVGARLALKHIKMAIDQGEKLKHESAQNISFIQCCEQKEK